jgi:ParB-like chromosome segregation protein Spo0J
MAADLLEINAVPTITLTGLSDAQRAAYVIADNKLALNAGWDFDTIRAELNMLQDLDFDLDLLGFDSAELDEIVNGWASDVDLPTTTNESSQSKIVVSCNELVKDDLLGVIERAVAESGIEQVQVSG